MAATTPFPGLSLTDALAVLETIRATYDLATQCDGAAPDDDWDTARCTDAVIKGYHREGLPERGWITKIPTGISGALTFQTDAGATFRLYFAGPARQPARQPVRQ